MTDSLADYLISQDEMATVFDTSYAFTDLDKFLTDHECKLKFHYSYPCRPRLSLHKEWFMTTNHPDLLVFVTKLLYRLGLLWLIAPFYEQYVMFK